MVMQQHSENGDDRSTIADGESTRQLYSAIAAQYDATFASPTHRRAYDLLAYERVCSLLPSTPCVIIDAGCGTGRGAQQLLDLGHCVIGIEHAPDMINGLAKRELGPNFSLFTESMETVQIAPASADLVIAMGSVQYTSDPAAMLTRFATWVKPGGSVCVHVDSLVALVMELLGSDRQEEALKRLLSRRGVFRQDSFTARLRLYDRRTLEADFATAGLVNIKCCGLVMMASAWGREGCARAMLDNEASYLQLERELSMQQVLADTGLHLFASGRRPTSVAS